MSKAEDLSRQYVLPFLDKHYEKYGEHKQMELSKFDGYDMMSAYEEGYHQAEKDLELTNADVYDIWKPSDGQKPLFSDNEVRDIWEYLDKFKTLYGHYPNDADEIEVIVREVINKRTQPNNEE